MSSIKNKLENINNRLRGYSQLALEFMELSQDQAIVSDQTMVQELLDAFDELVTTVDGDIGRLTGQIVTDTNTYKSTRGSLEDEQSSAKTQLNADKTAYSSMQARVAALNERASMDSEDVEQWSQFVIDEGIRCKDEEKAYEDRLCER